MTWRNGLAGLVLLAVAGTSSAQTPPSVPTRAAQTADDAVLHALLRQPRAQANGRAFMPSFLLTHPSYNNRSATIRERASELQRAAPGATLYVGRANLEQRVTRKNREFAE